MAHFLNRIGNIASTYGTDTIFILGKGPSVDAISPDVFASSLVIAVNDAERIAPADVTVFHADWVKQALVENGLRSRLYITSTDFAPAHAEVLNAPFHPLGDDSDLMMQRFLSDSFTIEDVLFLSALKIAREVARIRGRKQTVYMVGFDFLPNAGHSRQIDHDFAPGNSADRFFRISFQEFYFLNALYMLKESELDVVHVGERSFSQLSPDALNRRFMATRGTARDGCSGSGVAITAELTTNHFGDRHRLERMIRSARAAGADYVKLQKRDVASFYTAEQLSSAYVSPFGKTFADYRYQLELSRDDFGFVDDLCRDLGMQWFASVLDQPSFEFMLQFDPKLVKLPSTISEHRDYLSYVADNYRGSVVLSTGMTDVNYENWVLRSFVNCDRLYLMQCNSAYPTPAHDCNVGVVRHYDMLSRANPRIVPGYSSHDFGWLASALAVAAGSRILEKHVKLGNTDWAHFDAVAIDLTTPDFRDYVAKIREVEEMVGSETKKVNASEHHKYLKLKAAA